MSKLFRFPWYVLFISIYPALFYWAFNATEMISANGLKLAGFSFLFGIVCWGIALIILRNLEKASLVTFFSLLLFWSYGHIHNLLSTVNKLVFRQAVLVPLWVLLFALGVWWILKTRKSLQGISTILNVMTAFLLIWPLIEAVPRVLEENRIIRERESQSVVAPITGINEVQPASRPDIYYIILDSYTRADVLSSYFSYDNASFIAQLEELGFYVASCSQSNYAQTRLSLSSSLNYRYLDELYPIDPAAKTVPYLIKGNSVQRILENWGYKSVAFETGHATTELNDSDVFLSRTLGIFKLTEFDLSFAETTFLKPFMREPLYRADLLMAAQYRSRVLFVLDKLGETPRIAGPKFIFAHVLIPHPPFVLGPNGEPVQLKTNTGDKQRDREIYKEGFVNQTVYVNKRIISILRKIIDESPSPPIIILQGDHGPHVGKKQVTSILNAFYLPGGYQGLYETISPVNNFRFIFNTYFGQNLEMVEDIARWSPIRFPLQFEIVQNDCNPAAQTSKN